MTLRGVLILVAVGFGLLSLVLTELQVWLGSLSILVLALILALASLRQQEMNDALRSLRREFAYLERLEVPSGPGRDRKRLPYGPSAKSELVLEYARSRLVKARTQLTEASIRSEDLVEVESPGFRTTISRTGPAVSVIVPCYNDERFVADCLESVRRQVFEDWECVVIDDASVDASPSIIAQIAETDERIRYVRHGVNGGLPAARNTGLRLSSGRFVTFLDSDDLLSPDSLFDRLEALGAVWGDPSVAGTFCGVSIGSEMTTVDDLGPSDSWTSPRPFVDFINGSEDCPFPVLAPLVRKDVVVAMGAFDESMAKGAEDWDLWLRILRAGLTFVPSSLRSAVYRQRPGSLAKRDAAEHVRRSREMVEKAYSPIEAFDLSLARNPFLKSLDHYQRSLLIARRAIRSAAMSLVEGERDEASACLEVLEPGSWFWLDRHLDVATVAADGVRRGLGLTRAEGEAIRESADPFVQEIVVDVQSRTRMSQELPSGDGSTTGASEVVDLLLAPLNAAQLSAMLTGYADRQSGQNMQIGLLQVDRLAGDQGVGSVTVPDDIRSWSLNEWWLQRPELRNLLVPVVRDTTLEALVELAQESGVNVIELDEPGAEVMQANEAHSRLAVASRTPNGPKGPALGIDRGSAFGPGALDDPIAPESIWRQEERPLLFTDGGEIAMFANRHKGERAFIVGNGPSLNRTDLRKLSGEISFGVNAIFLATDDLGFRPTYYVVEDTAVIKDNIGRIRDYRAKEHRFFPSIYRDVIGISADTSFFNMNLGFYEKRSPSFCVPRFSTDASLRVFTGQSVTMINLQLAYYMGFSEIVLIGMDFSYTVPEDSIVEGNRILSMGDDPNHFHPDYFGEGKVWKDPKLDRVLANYQLAKVMYEADGRRIINATPGGKLELFERVDFDSLLG